MPGPQAKLYADYRKMLDDVKPQAVVIAVPLLPALPGRARCIAAGVDVFCEKTMCHTIDEARKLADEVAAAKRVFQVGLQRRANPIYHQAAAMVQAGVLGQVTAIKAQWHRNNNWRRPVPVAKGDADWSRLERKLNWRLYREYSGGLMTELGSHQLDVVNWLFGTMPRRVIGDRRRRLLARRPRSVRQRVLHLRIRTAAARRPSHEPNAVGDQQRTPSRRSSRTPCASRTVRSATTPTKARPNW